MARHRSRSLRRSPSRSPARRKRYDDFRDRRRDRRSPAPSGLLVRNISLSARPEDLRVPFERFGPIKDVYLPKNYHTGEPRGFGFVKFRHPEDAADAKSHLDRTVIGGREIRIVFAEENRKTPQEMRRISQTSSRGSYRRRSPSWSPRRRHYSYSRSPSPARRDSRARGYGARDDYYSPRQSRSVSRSISPRDDRSHRSRARSPRHSRSFSRSVSPQDEKNHKPSRHTPSPIENGRAAYEPSRSQSPGRNSRNPARSRSRSYSPR
ncbi:RNA-binding protein RBM8/Tsunagi (RRM superfamily) [Handroanthus impetiginosus]|uniref:RNA-binding protein RBM8/Tsunagi (RRM superfamily) n=1 Tax=Handroanthus impetiginosus TaxID=429701 RepID=A0A2G9GMX9_9LAMI|nr:RNA-binding protein RBM8/Tsunagi (RRM superfamily) [Handroanthus impetiginosus]